MASSFMIFGLPEYVIEDTPEALALSPFTTLMLTWEEPEASMVALSIRKLSRFAREAPFTSMLPSVLLPARVRLLAPDILKAITGAVSSPDIFDAPAKCISAS